jgi:diadenylate cyclase
MIELFSLGFITFTLYDAIDIIIVAIVFYILYRSLKGTIAVQILFGLLILLAVSFTTQAINLKSLKWILRILSDVWLIAFIILFQPELRRVLISLTRNKLFSAFLPSNLNEVFDEIIDATRELQEKHTGALIVFAQSNNIKVTVDTGIPIQAVVSKELVLSIFNTRSPLHDGAIVVDGSMIVAARCILPLSMTTKLEGKNLGTRHQAALGLSETSDAIILIISEETGAISLASNGELFVDVHINNLGEVLKKKIAENN